MSSKSAAEKISGLEARIVELEGEVVSANASLVDLQAEVVTNTETIANLTAERDEASGKLVTFEATIADQESTISSANEKLATFDQEVETKIQLGIASLGFKGEIPESSSENGEEVKTRSEFNALSPNQKMSFIKSGGKVK